jgi:hypothetical protein
VSNGIPISRQFEPGLELTTEHHKEQQIMPDTPTPPAAPDPWSMTPEQATAALAAMDRETRPAPTITPVDAQDARVTLDVLSRNPGWAESLFRGDVATRKQFDELVAKAADADTVSDAVAGVVEQTTPLFETTANGELPRRHVEGTIAALRDSGFNDESISQAVTLPPISRTEFMQAQALKTKIHGTAEWRGRLLSGDYEAKRQHNLLAVLLSSPIKDE